MHCNVWVLLTRQCICAIDNCSVILGFGVQVNVLVVVFVHSKVLLVSRQHFETEKSEVPNLLRRKARFLIFEKATLKFHLLLRLVIVETYLLISYHRRV